MQVHVANYEMNEAPREQQGTDGIMLVRNIKDAATVSAWLSTLMLYRL